MCPDDRRPRKQVVLDEDANAEEMEITLFSIRELREVKDVIPSRRLDRVEPWVRVRMADDWYLSADVELVYGEDDGA